eukprot:g10975.t1
MWHCFAYGLLLTLLLFPAATASACSACNFINSNFFVVLVCGYVAQLFLWRPQYKRGLEPDYLWTNFLFSPALDGIMHHLDGTMIREQVMEMGEEVELVGQQALAWRNRVKIPAQGRRPTSLCRDPDAVTSGRAQART